MRQKWLGILLILTVASIWFLYPLLFLEDSYYAAALPDDAYTNQKKQMRIKFKWAIV